MLAGARDVRANAPHGGFPMSGNKQPAKVVGGKPLTYEVQGESIEAGKGAEKAARTEEARWASDTLVVKSRIGISAWVAYCQGRADEAATRECPKSFPAKGWCECCRQPESVCDCLGPSSEASNGP